MRRVLAAVLVAVALTGCEYHVGTGSAMANMPRDVFNPSCPAIPEKWITGLIVPDTDGFAALQDDRGTVYPLIWGSQNKAAVDWGRRYRLGGTWFNGTRWWVQCENEVLPQ